MLRKFEFILLFILFPLILSIRIGHEVGSTSMDSTHFDRRIYPDQCLTNELSRPRFWLAVRSLSSALVTNNSNNTLLLFPSRRQLVTNYGDERLVTRATTNSTESNSTVSLTIDQALVDIIVDKQISGNLSVYVQVIECQDCPYEILAQDLSSTQILNLTLNTKYTYHIRIELSNTSFCSETLSLYEHGQYLLNIQLSSTNSTTESGLKCLLTSSRLVNNVYTPLIVGGVILITLFIFCIFAQRMKLREYLVNMKNRCCNHVPPQESTHSYDLQTCPPVTTICQSGIDTINTIECNPNMSKLVNMEKISHVIVPRSKRLVSLDAFRGFALIAMIFVNYGGGGYAQFEHSPWHGITFADVVFPLFVWILGVSLVFSLKNAIDKGVSKRTLLFKVLFRALKLFMIGFILNTRFKVDLNHVRILGVLQRFAFVYAILGTIEVLCSRTKQYSLTANLNNNSKHQSTTTTGAATTVKTGRAKRITTVFRDISNFPLQWLMIIGLTTIWILVVYLVPFENCPAGYLGPGGLHENGKYENCTGGITGYIDRFIFTEKHLYQYPSCQLVYGCKPPFDSENLLGAIPTTFLAYLGVQAGRILVMYPTDLDRLVRLFTWGIFSTAIGVGLTSGTFDGGLMPLNKNLWTLSFSFFTAGIAFLGFSVMYLLIDKFKWWNSTPFQYPGTNSILIYITHIVFATYFPVQWVVVNTHAAHLAMALWGCIFWIFIAYIFFKKRIFLVL